MCECVRACVHGRKSDVQHPGIGPLGEAELLDDLVLIQDLQHGIFEHPDVRLQLRQAERRKGRQEGNVNVGQ